MKTKRKKPKPTFAAGTANGTKLKPTPKFGFLEWREVHGELHPFLHDAHVRSGDKLLFDASRDEGKTGLVEGRIVIDQTNRKVYFHHGVGLDERGELRRSIVAHAPWDTAQIQDHQVPVDLFDRFAWPPSPDHPTEPVPDLAVKVFLVPHGYQVDYFEDGKPAGSGCRDFSGSHRVSKLKHELAVRIQQTIDDWRAAL